MTNKKKFDNLSNSFWNFLISWLTTNSSRQGFVPKPNTNNKTFLEKQYYMNENLISMYLLLVQTMAYKTYGKNKIYCWGRLLSQKLKTMCSILQRRKKNLFKVRYILKKLLGYYIYLLNLFGFIIKISKF